MKSILFLLLLPALLWGQEPSVILPRTLKVQAGRLLKIEAKSDQKIIQWYNFNSADSDLIVAESFRWAIFSTPKEGIYKILCYTAAGDKPSSPAILEITVGDGPKPLPPDIDDFTTKIQAIYEIELGENKKELKGKLAQLYSRLVLLLRSGEVATFGEFYTSGKKLGGTYLDKDDLPLVRAAFAEVLNVKLPTDPAVKLDEKSKLLASDIFNNFIRVLEQLK